MAYYQRKIIQHVIPPGETADPLLNSLFTVVLKDEFDSVHEMSDSNSWSIFALIIARHILDFQ